MTHNEDMQEIYDAIQDVFDFSWLQSVGLDIHNKESKTWFQDSFIELVRLLQQAVWLQILL